MWLRLNSVPPSGRNLTATPNQLLQKFPAPDFRATTVLEFHGDGDDRAGLVVMGETYAALMVSSKQEGLEISQVVGGGGETAGQRGERTIAKVEDLPEKIWLRVAVAPEARCAFSYSADGNSFVPLGDVYLATPGRWTGAKGGLISQGDDGYADFEWFRVH